MKISLFSKSYIIKACSFFIIISLLASTPLMVDAGFFSDVTSIVLGTEVTADETASPESNGVVYNSQTMPFLESSINPDLKNTNELENIVIVQNDSFIYSDGVFVPDVKFEKSPLSDQISVYTVEKDDTISEIAESFDVSMNTIRWENNISGQTISIGQKLNILPVTGVKHIVKSGDTIGEIAGKYEAETEDILIFNGISKGDVLKVGDIIFVPNGSIKTVIISKPTTSSGSSYTPPSDTKISIGYYMRPVLGVITSSYGSRIGGFHYGVDLKGDRGTSVVSAASGIVVKVISSCVEGIKSCGGRYGNHIIIGHPNGTQTIYAHLSRVSVSVGEQVSQGEKIGAVGNTGRSTGPHLHFQIEKSNGSTIRPQF